MSGEDLLSLCGEAEESERGDFGVVLESEEGVLGFSGK